MFNDEHYKKVWSARREKNFKREGYCFAVKEHLGLNGILKTHPLYGKKVVGLHNNKEYRVGSVNIHYLMGGYYYMAIIHDENNSSAQFFFENINCEYETILEIISDHKNTYKII